MKYLKKYATEADYSAAKVSIPTPNVVYVAESNKLYYNPEVGDIYAFTQESNPELMAFCYAQGWAAIQEAITYEECAAVTDIGTLFASSQIPNLEDLKWFTGLTTIAYGAFNACTATIIKLPEGVTTISGHAFYSCGSLKTIDCPSTVTSYGKDMLMSSTKNFTFISRALVPPTLSQSAQWAFNGGTLSVFKVPAASLEDYKAATNYTWLDTNNKFGTIEE